MPREAQYRPGRYWAKVIDQQLGYNNNDNKQFVLRFTILGRINAANPDGDLLPCEQFDRTIYRVINENTLSFVLDDLEALGFEGESFGQLSLDHPEAYDFRGQELAVFCNHDTYEGRTVERWGISRTTRAVIKPLEPKAQRELDSLFGKELKARSKDVRKRKTEEETTKQPEPAGITSEEAQSEAGEGGDDIPF